MILRFKRWQVWLDGRLVAEIHYDGDCDAVFVRDTLIKHEGYPVAIEVRQAWVLTKS